jgi:hypothetical protein
VGTCSTCVTVHNPRQLRTEAQLSRLAYQAGLLQHYLQVCRPPSRGLLNSYAWEPARQQSTTCRPLQFSGGSIVTIGSSWHSTCTPQWEGHCTPTAAAPPQLLHLPGAAQGHRALWQQGAGSGLGPLLQQRHKCTRLQLSPAAAHATGIQKRPTPVTAGTPCCTDMVQQTTWTSTQSRRRAHTFSIPHAPGGGCSAVQTTAAMMMGVQDPGTI